MPGGGAPKYDAGAALASADDGEGVPHTTGRALRLVHDADELARSMTCCARRRRRRCCTPLCPHARWSGNPQERSWPPQAPHAFLIPRICTYFRC